MQCLEWPSDTSPTHSPCTIRGYAQFGSVPAITPGEDARRVRVGAASSNQFHNDSLGQQFVEKRQMNGNPKRECPILHAPLLPLRSRWRNHRHQPNLLPLKWEGRKNPLEAPNGGPINAPKWIGEPDHRRPVCSAAITHQLLDCLHDHRTGE